MKLLNANTQTLKVHAQRKFAQGAFIPPSASAAVERRVDVTPSKDDNKNVYFNRMSAVSLLDIVAFQNMHSHTEPVVLLERLEEFQESMSQPVPEVNGGFTSPVKNTTNGNANHSKSKPAKPLRFIRPKRTALNQRAQRPQSMHLRSRLGSSFKPKSRAVKKKCRQKPSVAARALRRRRVPSPAESYDLDDDKPLTYIAQVLRRTVALRSDRSLRKRRGEELASTSKRRARVPIPTRPPKPPKPSVQAATSKANHAGSDSDDADAGATNGPTKPKQSNGPKSTPNGSHDFKVNEGAGTSKQSDTSTRREVGNRTTPRPKEHVTSSHAHPPSHNNDLVVSSSSSDRQTVQNQEMSSERTRDQQMRAEPVAAVRPARPERIMGTAAERGMQRRQAIAARQQQLAEGSHMSRRTAARRIAHTDGHNRAPSPQRPESESEPEPGPSKVRRKKQSSPGESPTSSPRQDKESQSQAASQPQTDPEPESGPPKVQKKKPATSTG
ncbi:hypothetical protein ABMA28_000036, partial [Loxostege sticticalis]